MKLMTFTEMCQMPHGTIFQYFEPFWLGELQIWLDGHPEADAYGYQNLGAGIEINGEVVGDDRTIAIFWPDWSTGTGGGMVKPQTRFLVYEPDDVARLRAALENPVALNDDAPPAAVIPLP